MNKHIGSDFDDFLAEQGLGEEVCAAALKRVIAWQIAQAMKHQPVPPAAQRCCRRPPGAGLRHQRQAPNCYTFNSCLRMPIGRHTMI